MSVNTIPKFEKLGDTELAKELQNIEELLNKNIEGILPLRI